VNVLRPLARPRVALIWAGLLVSATGDQFYQIALIWVAADLAGSAAGYLTAAQALCVCAVGILSGVLVDRWDNRRTMMVAEGLRLVAMLVIPVLYALGLLSMWHLYLVGVTAAACRAFYQPALQASMPGLVPDPDLRHATNSLLDGTRRFARILGAGMIGTVALVLPAEHFFLIAAAACLFTVLSVLPLARAFGHTPPSTRASTGLRGMGQDFLEVSRLVARNRALNWSLAGSTFGNAAWVLVFTLGLVLHVQAVLPGQIGAYGTIMAAYGVGNVAATLVVGSLPQHLLPRVMFASRLFYGGGIVLIAFAPDVTTMALAAAFASFGGPMNDIPFLALMQRHFPARQIGRVYAFRMVVDSAGLLAGSLLSAALYADWPVPAVIALTGFVMIGFGALALWRGVDRESFS